MYLSYSLEGQSPKWISLGLKIKLWVERCSFLKDLGESPFAWFFQLLKAAHCLAHGFLPFSSNPAPAGQLLFNVASLWPHICCHISFSDFLLMPSSSTSKDSCDYFGSKWIIQDNFVLTSATLIPFEALNPLCGVHAV